MDIYLDIEYSKHIYIIPQYCIKCICVLELSYNFEKAHCAEGKEGKIEVGPLNCDTLLLKWIYKWVMDGGYTEFLDSNG